MARKLRTKNYGRQNRGKDNFKSAFESIFGDLAEIVDVQLDAKEAGPLSRRLAKESAKLKRGSTFNNDQFTKYSSLILAYEIDTPERNKAIWGEGLYMPGGLLPISIGEKILSNVIPSDKLDKGSTVMISPNTGLMKQDRGYIIIERRKNEPSKGKQYKVNLGGSILQECIDEYGEENLDKGINLNDRGIIEDNMRLNRLTRDEDGIFLEISVPTEQ